MQRILIVEDERAIRQLLGFILRPAGFEIAEAASAMAGMDEVSRALPQLVLLDRQLPDMDGLRLLKMWRADETTAGLPVIMVSARVTEADRVAGLRAGADDYIVKPFSLRELTSRLRAALRRAYGELATGGDAEVRFGDVLINTERLTVERGGQAVSLTPTEFKLLRYLVAHPRQPISRGALIEAVWGYAGDIGDDRTVDVHMRHLREKLERDPANPRWLLTVRGIGYKFEP